MIRPAPNLQAIRHISIVCGAHFLNHFQSSMLGVLCPLMMRDLGIGFVAIGAITAVYGFVGNFLQAFFGFIVPYVRRGVLLGVGNILLGISVVATGFASSYPFIMVTRVLGGIGTSPQHPVGSTALASYFGKAAGAPCRFTPPQPISAAWSRQSSLRCWLRTSVRGQFFGLLVFPAFFWASLASPCATRFV